MYMEAAMKSSLRNASVSGVRVSFPYSQPFTPFLPHLWTAQLII